MRRAFRSASIADRSVEVVKTFASRAEAEASLATMGGVERDEHGLSRVWQAHKGTTFPCPEAFFVVGPAQAKAKTQKAFAKTWAKALAVVQ